MLRNILMSAVVLLLLIKPKNGDIEYVDLERPLNYDDLIQLSEEMVTQETFTDENEWNPFSDIGDNSSVAPSFSDFLQVPSMRKWKRKNNDQDYEDLTDTSPDETLTFIPFGAPNVEEWEEWATIHGTDMIHQPMKPSWWKGPNVCLRTTATHQGYPLKFHRKIYRQFISAYGAGITQEEDDDDERELNEMSYTPAKLVMDFDHKYVLTREEKLHDDVLQNTEPLTDCEVQKNVVDCTTRAMKQGVIYELFDNYKCCPSYVIRNYACTPRTSRSIIDILREIDEIDFRKILMQERVDRLLLSPTLKGRTLFVPTDKAMDKFYNRNVDVSAKVAFYKWPAGIQNYFNHSNVQQKYGSQKNNSKLLGKKFVVKNITTIPALTTHEVVLAQIAKSAIKLEDTSNNKLFMAEFSSGTIRINKFILTDKTVLITANCAPIQHWQPELTAPDGNIYVTNKLLPPTTLTIADILFHSTKSTIFRLLMQKREILDLLQRDEPFTFLLPTDEAFKKLDNRTKMHIWKTTPCGMAVLKSLIIDDVFCSAAFALETKLRTSEGSIITIGQQMPSKRLWINHHSMIIKSDIMALNGVIHVIDEFLLPDTSLQITQIMEKYKFTHLLNRIKAYDNIRAWDRLTNKTFFLPNNKAFDRFEEWIKLDRISYRALLNFFISDNILPFRYMYNDQMLSTQLIEKGRINTYFRGNINESLMPNYYTWNCIPIYRFDVPCCGGIAHFVSDIDLPTVDTIWSMIEMSKEFRIIRAILRGTRLMNVLKNATSAITFFAPINEAFNEVGSRDFDIIMSNKDKAAELFEHHILDGVYCCTGLNAVSSNRVREYESYLEQRLETFYWTTDNYIISGSRVTNCDNMASNGVVHFVERIISLPHLNL